MERKILSRTIPEPPAGNAGGAPGALRPALPIAALALVLAALLWTCRRYALGVPVADDYSFLARLFFHRPLDWFDSMGAAFYWRPLSRQLYYSALGGALLDSPWLAAVVNLTALLVTCAAVWGIARRGFSAPVAAALAALPLMSESARALIAWPSGAQHLLAGMFVALALHEAFASRWISAALATLCGLLSHELAVLALAALPVVAWWRARRAGDRALPRAGLMIPLMVVCAALAAWAIGYAIARSHGVLIPARAGGGFPVGPLGEVEGRGFAAALNLEGLPPAWAAALWIAYATLGALALLGLGPAPQRARRAAAGAAALAALAWFIVGSAPLTQILPDWNAWRAWIPSLGLAIGIGVAFALISPWFAGAFAGLRLVALLLAPAAPVNVPGPAPATPSHMSYVRIVRLQRLLESTRRTLHATVPALPSGARVRYWNLPLLSEVGYQGSAALRVWYRDSTLSWDRLGGVIDQHVDAMVEFRDGSPDPATAIEPAAFDTYQNACRAMIAHRDREADSLFVIATATTRTRGPMYGLASYNRACLAADRRDYPLAEQQLRAAWAANMRLAPDLFALEARMAFDRRDWRGALRALERCLAIAPQHQTALELVARMQQLGILRVDAAPRQASAH